MRTIFKSIDSAILLIINTHNHNNHKADICEQRVRLAEFEFAYRNVMGKGKK